MSRLRLAFMGTPDFAVPTLAALIAAGHDIAAVYSQPPRAAGRGRQPRPSPVQRVAEDHRIDVRMPVHLKTAEARDAFAALHLDAAVVVAYGLILPPPILAAPRLGCLNLHASLLPRWRGAAPIQRAIMAGDAETGVAVMRMDAGLDTGPVLLSARVAIGPAATAGELHDEVARLGAPLMVRALAGLADGRLTPRPQAESGVTYADKIDKAEARIAWSRPAAELDRRIRGLSPVPGAWFEHDGARIKVLLAEPLADVSGPPGTVLDDRLTVACGEGGLRPRMLQRAGKAPMPAEALLRGFPIPAGARLA